MQGDCLLANVGQLPAILYGGVCLAYEGLRSTSLRVHGMENRRLGGNRMVVGNGTLPANLNGDVCLADEGLRSTSLLGHAIRPSNGLRPVSIRSPGRMVDVVVRGCQAGRVRLTAHRLSLRDRNYGRGRTFYHGHVLLTDSQTGRSEGASPIFGGSGLYDLHRIGFWSRALHVDLQLGRSRTWFGRTALRTSSGVGSRSTRQGGRVPRRRPSTSTRHGEE